MIDSRDVNDLHPAVKRGAIELVRRMSEKGYSVGFSSTYRDIERQNDIYAQGRTKPGNVITKAKGGQSMHNYKLAFDIYKNIKGQEWADSSFFKTAGQIWSEMGGQWGGSWTGFVDTPHFEFTNGLSLSQLQAGKTVAQDALMRWEHSKSSIQPANENTSYVVFNVTSSLNIRQDANANASIVGSLKNNDVVQISETKNNFGKTEGGWVSMDYLKKI